MSTAASDNENVPKKKSTSKALKLEGIAMGVTLVGIVVVGGILAGLELAKKPATVPDPPSMDEPGHPGYVAPGDQGFKKAIEFDSELAKLWGLAVEPRGTLLVCGQGGVKRFTADGNPMASFAFPSTVRAVAPRAAGGFYAAMRDEVLVCSPEGEIQERWSGFEQGGNVSAVEETDEHVFVAVRHGLTGTIYRLDKQGAIQTSFGTGSGSKDGDVLNIPGAYLDIEWRDGVLYVANPGAHKVMGYSADGEVLFAAGEAGFQHTGFSGCCNPVTVTTLPSGQFISAEKGLPRVKQLDREGTLQTIVVPPIHFLKHAFAIDLKAVGNDKVFVADTGQQKVFVYKRKKGA